MKALADPVRLAPLDKKGHLLQVVVETPRKSRNKFAFDPEQKIFILKSVLPAGMVFPYDFGFLPRTRAEDGDPLDVLLLMDEPAYPGICVSSRLIGVIEGEQLDGKKRLRNDRLLAVAAVTHEYARIKRFGDLPEHWITELEQFFVNYHNLEGKKYRLLGVRGHDTAMKLIQKSRKALR
ncbi:MAG: inorganic diphosphatase [Acidobacterium ailaaui]|jgi:inorganic pyrophosphatase|nr:inorganic diphosphatase [Pseudacidobacterium ailaaui]MCL6463183.1 inorganic diphosphatase [Pseudacidobacterium ailaaui]MDI3253326.1 inorganic diphosphatase [Bacillota bacterium]